MELKDVGRIHELMEKQTELLMSIEKKVKFFYIMAVAGLIISAFAGIIILFRLLLSLI